MGVISDATPSLDEMRAKLAGDDREPPPVQTLTGENFTDSAGRSVRHPCDVTAERITNHVERYADQLTPNELRAITATLGALADIASGRRA